MGLRGVDFKWFDGFFLSMLATSVIVVSINWDRYRLCTYPLHIWIVVDYATVFVFRILMFVDNGLASELGPDVSPDQRLLLFEGRVLVLSCLAFFMYPFLWAWTMIGSLWFTSARSCLPEEGQKWGFLIWLLFSYCGLFSVGFISASKWLTRRQSHLQVAPHGTTVSELEVLAELIRVPEWAFRASPPSQEQRSAIHDVTYFPGLNLTPAQREAVESLIQQLPKFRLKGVPSECSSCPICLEEFDVGTEVRGLPCAHNFHVACIDEWLRLNIKCPHCRSSVFPETDIMVTGSTQPSEQGGSPTNEIDRVPSSTGTVTANTSSSGHNNFVHLQDLLIPFQADSQLPETSTNDRHNLEVDQDQRLLELTGLRHDVENPNTSSR